MFQQEAEAGDPSVIVECPFDFIEYPLRVLETRLESKRTGNLRSQLERFVEGELPLAFSEQ